MSACDKILISMGILWMIAFSLGLFYFLYFYVDILYDKLRDEYSDFHKDIQKNAYVEALKGTKKD